MLRFYSIAWQDTCEQEGAKYGSEKLIFTFWGQLTLVKLKGMLFGWREVSLPVTPDRPRIL